MRIFPEHESVSFADQREAIWKSALLIFVCSFCLRAFLIFWTADYKHPEFPEPAAIGRSVAEAGIFGDPYKVPTGITAHAAPFLPFLLAGVFKVFGTGQAASLAEALLSTTACSLQYALLPLTAFLLNWPVRIGTVAGLVGALLPFRFWLETRGTFEQTYSGLALLIAACMTAAAWRSGHLSFGSNVWRGIVWGVAFHISASLLPVCLLLLALEIIIFWRNQIRRRAARLAVMCLTMAILVVPWTARNYARFEKIFFMRDNLGLELAVSNRDGASPLIDENMGKAAYRHPNGSVTEALKVKKMGEIAYNQERLQEAKYWITNNEGEFLKLTLQRIWYFWFPEMKRNWQRASYALLTLLAFVGMGIALKRKQKAGVLLLGIWVAYPLIYYLIESSVRYRYPIDWTVLLLASFAVGAVGGWHGRELNQEPGVANASF